MKIWISYSESTNKETQLLIYKFQKNFLGLPGGDLRSIPTLEDCKLRVQTKRQL